MIATAAVMAAGAIYQGMAESTAAESQAALAEYNASVQENEARSIEQRTILESRKQAEESARRMGTMRAAIGKTGAVATEGSPLMAMAEQGVQDVNENQMIGYRGVVAAQEARTQSQIDKAQAKVYKQKAKSAKTASYISAGSSLLTGFEYGGSNKMLSGSGAIKIG